MIPANNPALKSWVSVAENSDFPIQNLPFGVFETDDWSARIGVAIGDQVLDITVLADAGMFDKLEIDLDVLYSWRLNEFAALGRKVSRQVRGRISELLQADNAELRDNAALRGKALLPMAAVRMCMPFYVRDYTDFYSSIEHATNVGIMFRGIENALMPNWKHLPVGYHGRASSIVVSGTEVIRPKGQMKPKDAEVPVFGPTKLLDFELEMAFVVGKGNEMGTSVSIEEAEDHIFGMVLFNDWSARDIQGWEYVPLGPFLGKSFCSTVSPWVVTMDALEPFRLAGPVQDVKVLPYLEPTKPGNFDIKLEVSIQPDGGNEHVISRSNFKYMYWSMQQQLAHHTVNGCNLSAGDMCASGTISGPTPDSYGSMLELTWRGEKPLKLGDGSERKFINDGDTVIMRGHCEKDGIRIGFGEVTGKISPAN